MAELGKERSLSLGEFGFDDIIIGPTEIVSGAVLIVKTTIMDTDNATRLVTRQSDGLDFISLRGMVELVHDAVIENSPPVNDEEDDHGLG